MIRGATWALCAALLFLSSEATGAPPVRVAILEGVASVDLSAERGLVVDRGSHGLDPHGPSPELLDDRGEEAPVKAIESSPIHPLRRQGRLCGGLGDHAVPLHLDYPATEPQQLSLSG